MRDRNWSYHHHGLQIWLPKGARPLTGTLLALIFYLLLFKIALTVNDFDYVLAIRVFIFKQADKILRNFAALLMFMIRASITEKCFLCNGTHTNHIESEEFKSLSAGPSYITVATRPFVSIRDPNLAITMSIFIKNKYASWHMVTIRICVMAYSTRPPREPELAYDQLKKIRNTCESNFNDNEKDFVANTN